MLTPGRFSLQGPDCSLGFPWSGHARPFTGLEQTAAICVQACEASVRGSRRRGHRLGRREAARRVTMLTRLQLRKMLWSPDPAGRLCCDMGSLSSALPASWEVLYALVPVYG